MSDRRALHLALILAALYVVVLTATAPAMGYTRDEGYYFKAAEQYGAWWDTLFSSRFFTAFTDEEIKLRFGFNTEHPILVKMTQSVTYRVFHSWLGWMKPSQAFRMTGILFAGLSLIATFLLGRTMVSGRVGLLAAALLAVLPRYFYDAHLACFDVPMTAMWALSLWSFWRALETPPDRAIPRALLAGVIFGLALATKLNALFLPPIFVVVWLWRGGAFRGFRVVPGPSGGRDLAIPPIPLVLISCAILGPLIFVLHWPYLWHETATRIGAYLGFHMNHEHYPISYFHELLAKPPFPWGFPVVMTVFTVPAPVLILGTFGFIAATYRALARRSSADLLLVISCALPIFLIAMPSTPIFGGVKHWYNAMPAMMIFAARAAFEGADAVAERWRSASSALVKIAAPAGLSVAMLLPGVLGSAASHPNGIGFYNEIAGGFRGGAELGMQRGFWGGLAGPLVPLINTVPPRTSFFFNRMNYDAYLMYRREGFITNDAYYANDGKGAGAGFVFEQPEHAEREGEVWSSVGTRPIAGVYQDNVTLVQLYERGRSTSPP